MSTKEIEARINALGSTDNGYLANLKENLATQLMIIDSGKWSKDAVEKMLVDSEYLDFSLLKEQVAAWYEVRAIQQLIVELAEQRLSE